MNRAALLRLAALRGRLFTLFADEDTDLVRLGRSVASALPSQEVHMGSSTGRSGISQPMIRKGYYEHRLCSDATRRGVEAFVAVGWDEALDIVAEAITAKTSTLVSPEFRIGPASIRATSRFHDPDSQLQRFLHCMDVGKIGTDEAALKASDGAAIAVPGGGAFEGAMEALSTKDIVENCKRVIFFSGVSDQAQLAGPAGLDLLNASKHIKAIAKANIPIVTVSPDREVTDSQLRPCWLQCRPGSEVAVILGLLHTLMGEGLDDRAFLTKYCTGFDSLESYVKGDVDGVPKNAFWAQSQSGIASSEIVMLARLMAADRCLIGLSASLLRVEHGQHVYTAATALACALGYIGLPGGGLVSAVLSTSPMYQLMAAYSFIHGHGDVQIDKCAGGEDRGDEAARSFRTENKSADAKVMYLGGSDAYLHADDSPQFRIMISSMRAVIVHASVWSPSASLADIVLPTAEFSDQGDLIGDGTSIRFSPPVKQSSGVQLDLMDDYDIFSSLAQRLGFYQAFTNGKSSGQWLRYLYEIIKKLSEATSTPVPDFNDFKMGEHVGPGPFVLEKKSALHTFRIDPQKSPLSTLSGKIDLEIPAAEYLRYSDELRHPASHGLDKSLKVHQSSLRFFQLVSDEPLQRFQSFLNFSSSADNASNSERQSIQINCADAYELHVSSGDVVSIVSARGAFLAEARVSDYMQKGRVQVETLIYRDLPYGTDTSSDKRPADLATGGTSSSVKPNSHKVLLYSYTVSLKKYSGERLCIEESSSPEILYNLSPTTFRSASRR